jgi:hypothetical protein
MKDSKLVETLRTLNLVDLIEIQKLLNTDVLLKGTARRESALLFDHLIRFYPSFDHTSLEKKATLAQLYNDPSGKINRLEKIMSTLLTAIEYYIINFVANKEFDELRNNLTLAKYYRQQGLSNRGDIFSKRLSDYFNNNAGLSIAHYYWYGQYLEEIGNNNSLKNSSGNEIIEKLLVNNKIYEMTINLDTLCKVVYSRATFDEYTTQVFERLSRKIENDEICKDNILVQLYSLALKMLQNIDSKNNIHYEKYTTLLNQSLSHINTESAKVLFTFQRSYTIQRYNRNPNDENTKEYSKVYREHLELGYLIVNGILTPNIVINLVLLAVKEKNGEWLHNFIQKWQNFIGTPTERTEILNFCWANYYFLVKDFDKAEDCISFNYQSVNYLLYTRRMRLKILFEKQEFISLSYESDAFKVYVFRQYKKKEIGEEAYNSNNAFADFIKQLDTLVHNPNAKKKEKVNKKINEKKCSDKEWLLEKIQNLKH